MGSGSRRTRTLVAGFRVARGEARHDLREVLEPRLAFGEVTLKPAHRRRLELRRPALGVQVDELQCILQRQVRKPTSSLPRPSRVLGAHWHLPNDRARLRLAM
jgi:hypothetical protein